MSSEAFRMAMEAEESREQEEWAVKHRAKKACADKKSTEDSIFKKFVLFLIKALMYIAVAFILYCVGEHFKRPGADNSDIETTTPEW